MALLHFCGLNFLDSCSPLNSSELRILQLVKMYRGPLFRLFVKKVGKRYSTTVKTVEAGVIERCVNKVTLLGRSGRDAEMKGSDANPMVFFPLATNETFKLRREGETDEIRQRTSWHRIHIFKPGLRDAVFTYCKKGSRLLVTGKINYTEYYNDSDQKVLSTNIVADDVIFLSTEARLSESDIQYDE